MSYKSIVCIKPVPDPKYYDRITINPVTKTITREGIPSIINPADKHALEAALQIKERYGGEVIVITMAPPNAEENLREALAMGADEAVLLSDRAFGGADTLATSYTLACGIAKLGGFDLIFTGVESADGATSQVPAQLAEQLNIPHLWNVKRLADIDNNRIRADVQMENGYMKYEVELPALFAVTREINKPRFTTIMGVMKAKKKPLKVFGSQDIEIEAERSGLKGSPTQAGGIYAPSMGRKGRLLKESAEESAAEIIKELRKAGVVKGNRKIEGGDDRAL
ncbi:MAG TPA: electron transfer flavoprotein subunit beta/FixA family protein [Anaerovoracaceae bacterium]|nr:electron transfer flavoprotein subunit beta/FixA family protein [Anaerovoracaceae bacterium]